MTPTPVQVLSMWEQAMRVTGAGNALMIALPEADDSGVFAVFYPDDVTPLSAQCIDSVTAMGVTSRQHRDWAAIAVAGYEAVVNALPVHGELEEMYLSGDESVAESVIVMIATTDGGQIVSQTFKQPLLEPTGDLTLADPFGPIAMAAYSALVTANILYS